MFRHICLIFGAFLLVGQVPFAQAQTEFKKALQKKYDFKSVSCFTCHQRKSEVSADLQDAFKENSKAFRNAFGKEFELQLKGKDITKRLADAKALARDDPKKQEAKDAVTKEFLDALKKVGMVKSPSGPTYGELLEKATLDGVKSK